MTTTADQPTCPADCPCHNIPLIVHWDRTVIHPDDPTEDTVVCCLTEDGQPVALMLDDELREALGLSLIDPRAEMDQP